MRAGGAIKPIATIEIATVLREDDSRVINERLKSAPIITEMRWGDKQFVWEALARWHGRLRNYAQDARATSGLRVMRGRCRAGQVVQRAARNFGFDIAGEGA